MTNFGHKVRSPNDGIENESAFRSEYCTCQIDDADTCALDGTMIIIVGRISCPTKAESHFNCKHEITQLYMIFLSPLGTSIP
jgi:hypothetical protein